MLDQPWLTAEQAIDLLLAEHEPVLNETVEISEGGEWRPPTLDERDDDVEWWCNGCHRPASRCQVMPIIALVADPDNPDDGGEGP